MTAQRQQARERLRLEAAERFALSQDNALVAKELRVHLRSVQRWRKAWSEGGVKFPLLADTYTADVTIRRWTARRRCSRAEAGSGRQMRPARQVDDATLSPVRL